MLTNDDNLAGFHSVVINSGLVNQTQWSYILRLARHRLSAAETGEEVTSNEPTESEKRSDLQPRFIADLMVDQGWVTEYQVEQLLAGRSRFYLGPYLITDFIGQGGMGQVFKAMHRFMDRECAVKVLPTSKSTNESIEGFMREIRMQAKLDHRHLVRAYDAGQDGNVHYLVTEYVPGMDLRKLVKQQGPLRVQQAASIIMQAALGLQYAHEQGLIHRDVKPGNILVTPDGVAKVSDVGLAGFAADLFSDPRAGKVVGTADYLSPEQIKSPLTIGQTSDIYSLGCTLYYAVCGKVPFPGGDTRSKLNRHLTESPRHPRRFAPALSDEFVDIIADMMEKEATRRTQTCAEVAARLDSWASQASMETQETWSRSPWMAPPPMSNDADSDLAEIGSEASIDSNASSAASISNRSLNRSSTEFSPSISGLVNETNGNGDASNSISTGIVIALTVAIVLPPALLIGFVLGYLSR